MNPIIPPLSLFASGIFLFILAGCGCPAEDHLDWEIEGLKTRIHILETYHASNREATEIAPYCSELAELKGKPWKIHKREANPNSRSYYIVVSCDIGGTIYEEKEIPEELLKEYKKKIK